MGSFNRKKKPKKMNAAFFNLRFEYDPVRDVITIEGVQYAGDLFRQLSPYGFETGTKVRFVRFEDGTFNLEKIGRDDSEGYHHHVKIHDN